LLKRYGKRHLANHGKNFIDKRTKRHINGIEGFWGYAQHILYNYRVVSKFFPNVLEGYQVIVSITVANRFSSSS